MGERFEVDVDYLHVAEVRHPSRKDPIPRDVVLAVDVPRIVRDEVERALRWQGEEDARDYITGNRYLASRFGPASEPIVFPGNLPQPTPSAPAEPDPTRKALMRCDRTCSLGRCELEMGHEGQHRYSGCNCPKCWSAAPPSEAPAKCGKPGYAHGVGYAECDLPKGHESKHNYPGCQCGECVAAARPEANHCPECGKECPANPTVRPGHGATLCLECVEKRFGTLCTACACERCVAERAFVRALAKQQLHEYGWTNAPEGVDPGYEMLKAAQKVIR